MTLTIFLLDGSVVSRYIKGILGRNCLLFQVNLCLDLTSDSKIYNSTLTGRGPATNLTQRNRSDTPASNFPVRQGEKALKL